MKILINSKLLAEKLALIDFKNEHVLQVRLETGRNSKLFIDTSKKIIELWVEAQITTETTIVQVNRRWDWVRRLVNETESQPIVLDITERNVNVIFSY